MGLQQQMPGDGAGGIALSRVPSLASTVPKSRGSGRRVVVS
jgi:hypothetical protein